MSDEKYNCILLELIWDQLCRKLFKVCMNININIYVQVLDMLYAWLYVPSTIVKKFKTR